ncbi:unnamed protein product, partial [Phaeothamnion confervicola]
MQRVVVGPELTSVIIESYDGNYDEHGCLSGEGRAVFVGGNRYEGSFERGMMHGHGTYTWVDDGTVYEGAFENNSVTGHGSYRWRDGSTFVGSVLQGRRHGSGVYTSASREVVYDGEWRHGKRHGRGTQWYDAERTTSYVGSW